jgi:hypothetical protein
MTEPTAAPYVDRKPGDMITADDWLRLQSLIQGDIAKKISDAVAAITNVATADDAATLGGYTYDQLAKQILEYVERQLPKRTGYVNVFRKLLVDKESVIDHKLGTWPLVTVFQLDYFEVVAAEDDHVFKALATFYLHHKSEGKIRFRPENQPAAALESVTIDSDGHPYHIPWKHMLELYGVAMPDDATLDEVESEFWEKFNAAPNDRFEDDQYYHSPWFDRCCGERRTVKQLAKDWDDIYFEMRPRLTLNYTGTATEPAAPTKLQVVQYDLESTGLILLENPTVPTVPAGIPTNHLKVLVLLKV